MKKYLLLLAVFLTGCVATFEDAVERSVNSLNLQTVLIQAEGMRCSGVVIAKDRVLTAEHCIRFGAPEGKVKFFDGKVKRFRTLKIGDMDASPDLALLEVETHVLPVNLGKMPEFNAIVLATGHPNGMDWMISVGKVLEVSFNLLNMYTGESFGIFIRHDASIGPGSSGGGLFDIHGNLIGIHSRKGPNDALAVPVDQIENFLKG